MKKDPVQYSLALKLKLNMITLPQLQDGITECFILTNRTFLERRMGKSVAISEIDSITRELIAQVFSENNISRSSTSISDIRKICKILDAQLGFEANQKLSEHHQNIIDRLFELAA
ncbi:MAG: hypothetical protein HN390_04650 [Anaerolineae bacterium]|jgi:hypothetical protein|nr:hypothetical protein [Anaerolineae bacterium]MBT4842162.1 hypothetical protein [Anaerolineae bacterium]MBT7072197.1 hypothetical protein [Anaerolineae bacterium]MBT7991602.1 hypothetical protein [Anaerolineae bacterium]